MKRKVLYYSDPIHDDFAKTHIQTLALPENFQYLHTGKLYRAAKFLLYDLIVRPLVAVYLKVVYLQKAKNRQAFRQCKDTGFFLYGNHTQLEADAFIPNTIVFPKTNYIVVGPDAMSIKGLRGLVAMLGGVPLPSSIHQYKSFLNTLEHHSKKCVITIYPEAHIWPYYTDIRPFPDTSFSYPVQFGKPVFSFTNVYVKRKIGKKPRIITWIDGPFFPDPTLPPKAARKKLRDEVYHAMKKRTEANDNYEYIKYIYREKPPRP